MTSPSFHVIILLDSKTDYVMKNSLLSSLKCFLSKENEVSKDALDKTIFMINPEINFKG